MTITNISDVERELHAEIDRLKAELARMQGRELKLQFALAEQPAQQQEPDYKALYEKAAQRYNELAALMEQPAQREPQPPYEFERYVAGSLMAQGVRVERATTLADAMRIAAKICPLPNPPSWPTVLVYTSPPAQRTWVGMTHEEHMEIMTGTMTTSSRMAAVEAKLKEKNT